MRTRGLTVGFLTNRPQRALELALLRLLRRGLARAHEARLLLLLLLGLGREQAAGAKRAALLLLLLLRLLLVLLRLLAKQTASAGWCRVCGLAEQRAGAGCLGLAKGRGLWFGPEHGGGGSR